uniref:Chromosome LG13 open reading frame, human C7orf50 n=1 Tax=Lepisosteus oculatus TaxID=7918 RepID=W5M7A8_LEPOC|nr:PREDICTED: uncharacterized protein C7orf50 homolog [Lepisosteus oculatus]
MAKNKKSDMESERKKKKSRKEKTDEAVERIDLVGAEDTTAKRRRTKTGRGDEECPLSVGTAVESQPEQLRGKKPKKRQAEEKPDSVEVTQSGKKEKKRKKIGREQEAEQDGGEDEEEEWGDLSPEERRQLERKVKKEMKKEEKRRLKATGVTLEKPEPSKATAAELALDYLTCWSQNRAQWRFQKTRQTWLLQHMYDSDKVPEESFAILLQYLEGLRGSARDTTVTRAEALVNERDGTESGDKERTRRAREVIQLLS